MTSNDPNTLEGLPMRLSRAAQEYKAAGMPDRRITERVMQELVQPTVSALGIGPVTAALAPARSDPWIAAFLIDLSGDGDQPRATEFFSDEELATAALSYLRLFPDAGVEEGGWAWTALWNGWGQIEIDDQMRIMRQVLQRVPSDDGTLWMLGDGPMSLLTSDLDRVKEIESWPETREKVERMWALVAAGGP
jgi:hypothetical protein